MQSLAELTSLLAGIRQAYPQARITSGYRSPSNPLSRANPHSPHMGGSPDDPTAVDIAPIPGVNFNDYVNSVRQAGVPIAHAYDEAAHPFKWTTGPNWHLDTAGAPRQVAAAPRKPRTLGDVTQPTSLANLAPTPIDVQPAASLGGPQTLADLTQQMPGVPEHKKSPFTLGNILGVIGDGLLGYAGMKPEFAPALQQQQQDERAMQLKREEWNAELAQKRQEALAKAAEPPAEVQTAAYWDNLRQTNPGLFARMMTTMDAYNPKTTIGPQGEQIVPRVQSQVLNGKVYHKIGGQWVEEVQ